MRRYLPCIAIAEDRERGSTPDFLRGTGGGYTLFHEPRDGWVLVSHNPESGESTRMDIGSDPDSVEAARIALEALEHLQGVYTGLGRI